MALFFIDKAVIFDSDTSIILHKHASVPVANLSPAAGRCLKLILEREGKAVSRDELLQIGWGSVGQIVSDNSLNQAITQIRRAVKSMKIESVFIVTVSRVGYRLAHNIKVRKSGVGTPVESVELSSISGHLGNNNETVQENVQINEPLKAVTAKALLKWFSLNAGRLAMIGSALTMLLSFSIFYVLYGGLLKEITFPKNEIQYLPYNEKLNGLSIYYSDKISDRMDYLKEGIETLRNDKYFSMKLSKNPDIKLLYVNGALKNNVFGFFLCKDDIRSHPESCAAYTDIMESENE